MSSSSTFKLFQYFPFPTKNNSNNNNNNNSNTSSNGATTPHHRYRHRHHRHQQQQQQQQQEQQENKSLTQKQQHQQNKPACIAIVTGKDGMPVTKCIAPAVIHHPPSLSSTETPKSKKQRRISSFILPKFRYSRNSSFSPSKVAPFHNRFHQLPSELLIHIVTYLDLPSVLNLSLTSKFCHRICGKSNNYLWHTLYQAQYHHYLHHSRHHHRHHHHHHHGNGNMIKQSTDENTTYYNRYQDQYALQKRWQQGKARSHYLTGHEDSVYCLVWVNQHLILSGSRDRSIKLWDVDRHECLETKRHHQGSVLCLAVAADASFFISGSSDATLVCWSLPDMTPQKRLEGHLNGVLDVCLVDHQKGRGGWVVSSSRDTTVRVWNIEDGRPVHRLTGHNGPVNALEHVKGTHHVISASGDATLKLWDVSTAQCLRTFVGHQRGLACVRYDPFMECIISGGQDGKIKIWDMKSADCLQTMTGHADLIRTVDTFQGNVVSGSYDRTLRVWDASTGTCLLSFHSGHTSWIFNVLINSTKIISAGQDKKIMILDFGYELKTL